MREGPVAKRVWLAVSKAGARLWRNNVGMLEDKTGRWVKFGVGGKGGSDYIGLTPVKILPEHVGRTFAVFTALEIKGEGTKIKDDQIRYIELVRRAGGIAGIAYGPEEAVNLVQSFDGKPDRA